MSRAAFDFDVVVLGAGPGGVAAATSAALKGLKVALISARWLMGYGLEGAYKSKTMFELAREFQRVQTRWKGAIQGAKVDLANLRTVNDAGAERLRQVQRQQLAGMGVTLLEGHGRLVDPHTVEVGAQRVTGAFLIVATGTRPRCLPGVEPDAHNILTSDEVVSVDRPLRSLLVMGAGVIGCEFAAIFAAIGAEVTLIDSQPRILNHDDDDVSAFITHAMARLGVRVIRGARTHSMICVGDEVHTVLQDGQRFVTDAALLAIGRLPNTEGIGLEAVGLATDARGYIPVSDAMQSAVPHIYAVGDVGQRQTPNDMALVHVAEAEGRAAVSHILGERVSLSEAHVPFIIFTLPMVAGAGYTEREARAKFGDGVRVGKFAHVRNPRAHAMSSIDGFVKLIVGPPGDDRILGARAVGEGVDVIVGQVSVMIEHGLPYTHLLHAIHAHPSLCESLQGAAMILAGEKPPYLPGEELTVP